MLPRLRQDFQVWLPRIGCRGAGCFIPGTTVCPCPLQHLHVTAFACGIAGAWIPGEAFLPQPL